MRSRRIVFGVFCWVLGIFAIPSKGAEETNGLIFTNITLDVPDPHLPLTTFRRYERELTNHQAVLFDKFGPSSYFDWARRYSREGYAIHNDINSLGFNGVTRLLTDSARETAVAVLPVDQWQSVGQLLLGSIGNTAEERAQVNSLSYSETEQLWRQDIYQTGVFRYGVRPWRTNPYGYFGLRVGHWGGLENLPLFVLEGRVGYKLFGSGTVEGRLAVPFPNHFQFVAGIGTDPLRFNAHHDNPTVLSGRLQYTLDKPGRTKVMYLGAQSSSYETLIAAGFIFSW